MVKCFSKLKRRQRKTNDTRKIQKNRKNRKNRKNTKNRKQNKFLKSLKSLNYYKKGGMDPEENVQTLNTSMDESIQQFQKANATRKIQKFMKKYEGKRKALFLKSVCSDSGVCIAFGTEEDKIKQFFDDFDNFDLLSKPAKRIGDVSTNGFVKELTYEKEGYVSNAILKSSIDPNSDNLFYEGLVGQFINKQAKIYPCFVETYGLYYYTSLGAFLLSKNNEFTPPGVLRSGLTRINDANLDKVETFEKSCVESLKMAILIQHLKDVKSLKELLRNSTFLKYELLYVLFQVYAPLASLADIFTHYDLHTSNILLYEPVNGSYIEYHYIMNDGNVMSFKSKYIAKIIDYGRCYFDDKSDSSVTGSSAKIYNELCNASKCIDCGSERGFTWLEGDPNKYNFFIVSRVRNKSHDLRLVDQLKSTNGGLIRSINKPLYDNIINVVKYGQGITDPDNKQYGTREETASDLPYINNVWDMYMSLGRMAMDTSQQEQNEKNYEGLTKLGDLHIYLQTDKPMEFIPVQ